MDSDKMEYSDGDGNSLLHMAVKILQPDLCKTLIQSGSHIETVNDQGNSPLFELFNNADNGHINDNVEKTIETLNILIESGIDVNKITNSETNVFQLASQWNSERLMLSLLSKQPKVTCLTETDFKLAFTNQWFEYAATLISLMTEDFLQSFITNEIFQLTMIHSDPNLLMSLFVKSSPEVQQSVIEDLMNHFALIDEFDDFVNLLKTEIIKPKLFLNGETLLTNLLKKKNLKYCWEIINCGANKKCASLANAMNRTPLQIAIETELIDLICPLIFNFNNQSNLEFNWHAPLISLFQKLSMSNNNDVDQKLLAAIKTIISRGGDIYKESLDGSPIINYCTRFKEKIKTFQNNERSKEHNDKYLRCLS